VRTTTGKLLEGLVAETRANLQREGEKGLRGAQRKSLSSWLDAVLFDLATQTASWKLNLSPLELEALEAGGQRSFTLLDLDPNDFSVVNPRVAAILKQREQIIKTIVANREAELRATLGAGYEKGENLRDLMKRLDDYGELKDFQAERIARTEMNSAANAGNLEGGKQAGMDAKEWISSRDTRVRDAHWALDGTTVGIDENFHSETGAAGPGPGQMGNAADDCNDRCTLLFGPAA